MTWITRSSTIRYENPWISVREDAVTGPGGNGIYGVVSVRHPAVFVVALDEEDRVCLVRLHRYTTGETLEVPAGGTDGEDPLVAAARELREETGLIAQTMTPLGRMNALNGIADAPEFVFLAQQLSVAEDDGSDREREGISEVLRVPFRDVLALIADGSITDSETIASLMHAAVFLGRVS